MLTGIEVQLFKQLEDHSSGLQRVLTVIPNGQKETAPDGAFGFISQSAML